MTRTDDHPARAARLRRLLEITGGFTLHHRTGEPMREGVSVCADPELTLRFPWADWDDDLVDDWVEARLPHLATHDTFLGGWLDSARDVWLDVVRVFPEHHRRAAVAFGRHLSQQAVFDLGERRLVPLVAAATVAHSTASVESMSR